MEEWMDGWMDEWMNGWMNVISPSLHHATLVHSASTRGDSIPLLEARTVQQFIHWLPVPRGLSRAPTSHCEGHDGRVSNLSVLSTFPPTAPVLVLTATPFTPQREEAG